MREPGKTRLIALGGMIVFGLTVACVVALMLRLGSTIDRWLLLGVILGALYSVIILARIEYGEWLRGVPWWERMKDGYRPPIKLPTDDPNANP